MKKLLLFSICFALLLSSCKKKDEDGDNNNDLPYALGWSGDDDVSSIPVSVNSSTFGFGSGSLPAAADLVPKFPPIGDQGQFGTCVAWATAYNYKTAIEGMDKGLTTTQLAQSNNQLSPKDLFTAIDDSKKGSDCNGTDFTVALDVVLQRGVATFQTVPYTSLNGCSKANLQSSWTSEAAGHKINNYRKIDVNINTIKSNIANNIPVIFGARLGDNFMTWNSDQVITSHSGFDNVGIHAYHALVCAGYDDSKGPNGAFRVINSWGTAWGDQGYIWIDYNFLVNEFCYGGNCYIATNGRSDNNPPDVDPNVNGSVDLATWAFSDVSTSGYTGYYNSRTIVYDVYNIGDETANASSNWSLYYIYYNAYNANDYGFLFYDEFNTSIASNTYNCSPSGDHCVINYNIPSGGDLASGLFGYSTLYQNYFVPVNLTGYYYLLLFADASDAIQEPDEQNNYFYTTDQYPVYFNQGYAPKRDGKPAKALADYKLENSGTPSSWDLKKQSHFRTAVNQTYPNAYSIDEIKKLIRKEKQNGNFRQKLETFQMQKNKPAGSLQGK